VPRRRDRRCGRDRAHDDRRLWLVVATALGGDADNGDDGRTDDDGRTTDNHGRTDDDRTTDDHGAGASA